MIVKNGNFLKNKRLEEIDIAKGIGIILVILGHAGNIPGKTFIYSFHMPLFFILSGMVMKKDTKGTTLIQRINDERKLIAAYLICSIAFLLFGCINLLLGYENIIHLLGRTYQAVCLFGISVLWFISCLAIAKIFVYEIKSKIINKKILALFAGVLLLIGCTSFPVLELIKAVQILYYPITAVVRAVFAAGFVLSGYLFKETFYMSLRNLRGGTCYLQDFL
ncbi:MAG: acyltransferase family protein [Clostridiales bacterium]|nr:acyltransferase family protein [Clostridiales bacterium]